MREHMGLFRGKRIDNGEWVEGSLLYDREQNEAFIAESFEDRAANIREVDPDTVGECTGLRDKNGKLIFEGDMLLWDEREYGCKYIEEVRWDYRLLGFRVIDWGEWCEIIGNIHDNPELLKGGEGE